MSAVAVTVALLVSLASGPAPHPTATLNGHTLALELAVTEASRAQGLMFRPSLDGNTGMLFVFPDEPPRTFWMRNTLIALDMIFISGRGRVVGVVPRATPRTDTPRGVFGPARYVLEVNGGWAVANGVRVDMPVTLENVPAGTP